LPKTPQAGGQIELFIGRHPAENTVLNGLRIFVFFLAGHVSNLTPITDNEQYQKPRGIRGAFRLLEIGSWPLVLTE
jgi:hypothetical protein